jgi:endoglucanase
MPDFVDYRKLGVRGDRTHSRGLVGFVPGGVGLVALMALSVGWGAAGCHNARARVEAFRTGKATTRATGDLRRGMNFGDAMDAPHEGDWGFVLSSADFRTVREAGFDHVRVPMRVSAHVASSAPYRIEGSFFRRIDWVIDQSLSNDLGVIIDLHHFLEMMKAPRAYTERLVAIWRQIALRYRGLPAAVVFEILNEPTDNLTAEVWNPILARVIAAIREIDPERTLIVEGAHWASAKDLRDTLRVPEGDPHLIASFHMYAPMYFTHQGFGWMPSHYSTRNVVFPGPPPQPVKPSADANAFPESRAFFDRYNREPPDTNPGGPAAIVEQMEMAQAFAQRTGIRIYLGEFGAGINADIGSRARWTRTARQEAEKRGFGWGYWDFTRNFAAYSSLGFSGGWIPEMKAALLD